MIAKCMYFKEDMVALKQLCDTLYSMEGCGAGGNLHILLDDDNYDDDSILWCLKECLLHPEHPSSMIGIVICHEYLKMSIKERVIFDWYWNGADIECSLERAIQGCYRCEYMEDLYDQIKNHSS